MYFTKSCLMGSPYCEFQETRLGCCKLIEILLLLGILWSMMAHVGTFVYCACKLDWSEETESRNILQDEVFFAYWLSTEGINSEKQKREGGRKGMREGCFPSLLPSVPEFQPASWDTFLSSITENSLPYRLLFTYHDEVLLVLEEKYQSIIPWFISS